MFVFGLLQMLRTMTKRLKQHSIYRKQEKNLETRQLLKFLEYSVKV